MTSPQPTTCESWPLDTSCCSGWEEIDEALRESAIAQATDILALMTGYQFGICRNILRPCPEPRHCGLPADLSRIGPEVSPYIDGGRWYNCPCGKGAGCDCTPPCAVTLSPGPVRPDRPIVVTIDGVVLDPTAYVVYDWRQLVRVDGGCWPDCQEWGHTPQSDPEHLTGVWTADYYFGQDLDAAGKAAYSELVCQLAKAGCGADDCALPAGAVTVVRDGITINLDPKMWINNIPRVANWIYLVNPNGLMQPPRLLSPGRKRGKVQTWPILP